MYSLAYSLFYCPVNLSLAFRPSFVRSGSVRSCPRQFPPHLEMTLVYCSRDFSTLSQSVSQSLLTEISIVSTNLQLPTRHYTGFMLLISLFCRYIYGSFPSYIMRLMHDLLLFNCTCFTSLVSMAPCGQITN